MWPDRSQRADSSHATGTERRALTAHSCAASVESSSPATGASARGRRAAADCRVYRPSAFLPVIAPTSTGGGTPPSSRGSRARRWGRPLPADSRDGAKEPAPVAGATAAPALLRLPAEWSPTCVFVPTTRQHQAPAGEWHRPPEGAVTGQARHPTVATDQTPESAAVPPA
eukprot:3936925-Rhodomonas_salina.1